MSYVFDNGPLSSLFRNYYPKTFKSLWDYFHEEGAFVGKIYAVRHFQQNIEQQKILKGGKIADPFVIARAAVERRAVVTTEKFKEHGAKIPNICKHFDVECLSLEEFMEREEWEF